MKSIFEFIDYKAWVRAAVKESPRGGRGAFRRIAETLRLNTSMVSQIFNGPKELSIEAALELAVFFGLSPAETDYLVAMVDVSRAGTPRLQTYRQRRLESLRQSSLEVIQRLPRSEELGESDKALFYSQWYYAAISLICGIPGFDTPQAVAEALVLPIATVREALDFLIAKGLVVKRHGKLAMGTARTHVPYSSPLAVRHHVNWRLKNLTKAERLSAKELMFTSPMTLSAQDVTRVRAQLLEVIASISKIVDPSPAEELWALNIDLVAHLG